tara:strand:- start:868 stop:1281 length:414 start_codon:yes stop_codon:yes gene_type:complete
MTVKLIKLSKGKTIKNKKGNIIKFINKRDKLFKKFGELYFSEIKIKKEKGWNYHKKNTCLINVPFGKVRFRIYNVSKNKIQTILLSDKNNLILQIPPKNWFSFKSLTKKSLVANILDNVHQDKETDKKSKIKNFIIK